MKPFPVLEACDIECRVSQAKKDWQGRPYAMFLLYKDARVDQRMLDREVGEMNWQRKHEMIEGKLYCTVSIWDSEKNQWVGKQDVGVESNTEKEKGQASDAFKRACFNWGIGRELYTSPTIKVSLEKGEYKEAGDKVYPYLHLNVVGFECDSNRQVCYLLLTDDKGKVRYQFGSSANPASVPAPAPVAVKTASSESLFEAAIDSGKPCINPTQFKSALKRIQSGELALFDKIKETYTLTSEQYKTLDNAVAEYKINNNIK